MSADVPAGTAPLQGMRIVSFCHYLQGPAAMQYLAQRLGRRVGGSSGTNLIGALIAAKCMVDASESGSIVAILCDGGERYATTYYDPAWLKEQGYELDALISAVAACVERGEALPESVLRANI